MRLATFIRANIEPIASEWERFAATLLPAEEFESSVLRNDIVELLVEIASDMDNMQTGIEQRQKAEGDQTSSHFTQGSVVRHALARFAMGLSARQFISEFRALRATVIRLWQSRLFEITPASLNDMVRFNEAIDQVLTEGATAYTHEVDRSRELFLSILGHDLRNPLTAIIGLAEMQLAAKLPKREHSNKILVSARRMSHMINDLLELARVRLGSGITLHTVPSCMRRIAEGVVEEIQTVFPKQVFHLLGDEAIPGEWDENRITQVVSNLVSNAAQHGISDSPIIITARTSGETIEVAVHNEGTPIPCKLVPRLFDSFYRLDNRNEQSGSSSLGLGLYICKEIIAAHGGTIDVQSAKDGTTFRMRLPKTQSKLSA